MSDFQSENRLLSSEEYWLASDAGQQPAQKGWEGAHALDPEEQTCQLDRGRCWCAPQWTGREEKGEGSKHWLSGFVGCTHQALERLPQGLAVKEKKLFTTSWISLLWTVFFCIRGCLSRGRTPPRQIPSHWSTSGSQRSGSTAKDAMMLECPGFKTCINALVFLCESSQMLCIFSLY